MPRIEDVVVSATNVVKIQTAGSLKGAPIELAAGTSEDRDSQ